MATIDLIVLGMLRKEAMSAYDMQKMVEYRNISRWVKISTPSIYKKVIQLADKGFITSETIQGENLADKVVYSLTSNGEEEFFRLMDQIAEQPVLFFLDFNAVIVNLDELPDEQKKRYLHKIRKNVGELKARLEANLEEKADNIEIPASGLAVLKQQFILANAIEDWLKEYGL